MGTYCDLRIEGGDSVSLEKAWHGLHFLLTGGEEDVDPGLGFLLDGGGTDEPEGDFIRRFTPEEVHHLNSVLSQITGEQLWTRFDAARMTEEGIYPDIWDEPEADLREEYLMYFEEMKRLIHQASESNAALLVDIS